MSKKNKALKQLLKSQMQANVTAVTQGKQIPTAQINTQSDTGTSGVYTHASPVVADKQVSEFVLIKKDIRLSLILISIVIICLFVIYFIDKANPFLLPLANKIFQLISK